MTTGRKPVDARLEQAFALLKSILQDTGEMEIPLTPWEETHMPFPQVSGRLSATDRLSWWFRPAQSQGDPWDDYFSTNTSRQLNYTRLPQIDKAPEPPPTPPTSWNNLRLLLDEQEEEMLDEDADTVTECLYNFIHAIGRGDLAKAMTFVAPDFHSMEDDQEIDQTGLENKLRFLLDSLRGWDFNISLVEIPQPILYPDAILIYAETQIDAVNQSDDSRQTILERRIAVFQQQPDDNWLLAALSPVERLES